MVLSSAILTVGRCDIRRDTPPHHDGGVDAGGDACSNTEDMRLLVGIALTDWACPGRRASSPPATSSPGSRPPRLALPDAYEEDAWTGREVAGPEQDLRPRPGRPGGLHVGVPRHDRGDRPTTVLTFRSSGDELLALTHAGPPFYQPPWSPTVVGMVLDDDTDWDEVAELVTESYRFCAPQKLRHRLDR